MQQFKKITAWLLAILLVALTGCASTQKATEITRKHTLAYGLVMTYPDGTDAIKQSCENGKIAKSIRYTCDHPDQYKIVRASIYETTGHGQFGWYLAVPVDVPADSIVEFNPSKEQAGFIRVAAEKESDTCRWKGLKSPTAKFIAGFTLVGYAFASSLGVECNGWSYKSLIDELDGKVPAQPAGATL